MLFSEQGTSLYEKFPATTVEGRIWSGWGEITRQLARQIDGKPFLMVFDTYIGVYDDEIQEALRRQWPQADLIDASTLFCSEEQLRNMTEPYVTEDEIFGYLSPLAIGSYFDAAKLQQAQHTIRCRNNPMIVYGCGAGYVAPNADLTVYADMARWEIQQRFRARRIHGLGVDNSVESPARQ